MIQTGDKLPSVPVKLVTADGVSDVDTAAVLGEGRVVLFAVPGAFTPTCDTSHLPGFVSTAERMKSAGVRRIVCATANDHHVTQAWAERAGALGKVDFIADAWGAFADALGLARDFPALGRRYVRFAAIIDDGVLTSLFVQDAPGVTVSGAPAILLALQGEPVS